MDEAIVPTAHFESTPYSTWRMVADRVIEARLGYKASEGGE